MSDLNALSYWFPKIRDAGLPVPKTAILTMPPEAIEAIFATFDGAEGGDMRGFITSIDAAASSIGYPVFLRTGHTSAKHGWRDTCRLERREDIGQHVSEIVLYSEMCSIMGLPWDEWAVREFLPTIPFASCPGYGDMPVCREFRAFVDDEVVRCIHPYWPREALEQGRAGISDEAYSDLCWMHDEPLLRSLASHAGRIVGGSWSVDMLETKRGWFVTDMALADRSFHWEGCPYG